MNYVISDGSTKDIQVGDALGIQDGVVEVEGSVKFACIAQDVSNPESLSVAAVNLKTATLLETFILSPSWITSVWREI